MTTIEIENRRRRRAVQPSARFPWIHDQRLAARLHLLLMRAAVDHDVVRGHRAPLHVTDVVNQENPPPADLEAVRRLEQLGAEAGLCAREQPLRIAVVPAEDPRQRY